MRDLPQWMYDSSLSVKELDHRHTRWLLSREWKPFNPEEEEIRKYLAEVRLIFHLLPLQLVDLLKLWIAREKGSRENNKTGPWNR